MEGQSPSAPNKRPRGPGTGDYSALCNSRRPQPVSSLSNRPRLIISSQLDSLVLRRDVASSSAVCYVLYLMYYREDSEGLFNFVPAADFHRRSIRGKYHHRHFHG
ncbi:hypothetical protein EVAR_45839_1 [Eumeta japonica]|uniref:Uncharacterized protein n=1 Tax=Eumeta variegata TaxID=151549 RepID=A0A4C1WMB9_EUMVA|nr:hypothetical protein EVAR_45839_1 [Eumeta japonica]